MVEGQHPRTWAGRGGGGPRPTDGEPPGRNCPVRAGNAAEVRVSGRGLAYKVTWTSWLDVISTYQTEPVPSAVIAPIW